MIKILQIATVIQFLLFLWLGIGILLFATEKIDAYGQLMGIIFPFFLAEVVPALIGTPLKEAVSNLRGKNNGAVQTE